MQIKLLITFLIIFSYKITLGQCDLDFGSSAGKFVFSTVSGSDIVNGASSGANDNSVQSFDIWDETNGDCSTAGGVEDITFEFKIIHVFDDVYDNGENCVIDAFGGSTHDITQTTSGLRGSIPMGNSSANESATGNVRGYEIKITFASHVNISAADMTVNMSSVNTAGQAHESSSLVFLNMSGAPYNMATYNGYYDGEDGASNTSCIAPAARTNSWLTSGAGAYTASSTVTTEVSSPCNPTGDLNGARNNYDVNPYLDTGLNASDMIGGIIFTVYLEDVAASTPGPCSETLTSTSFISTLNGIDIGKSPLAVEYLHFLAEEKNETILLEWATASEENNARFEVEWSEDGSSFDYIGRVEGQGTSFSIQNYKFIHATPLKGDNYYRLKQIDFNGNFEYSNIVVVRKLNTLKKDVSVFPNPTQRTLNITKPTEQSTILIFDINRTLLKSFDNIDRAISIDTDDLPAGTYFISIHTQNDIIFKNFVKL